MVLIVPYRFTSMTRSIWSKPKSAIGTNFWIIPAMLSSPSTWPCAAVTAAGSASTASRSVMLTTCVEIASPFAPASFTVSARPASLRSMAATRAPFSTSWRATSRPMPLPAPVTTQTFEVICMMLLDREDARLRAPQG